MSDTPVVPEIEIDELIRLQEAGPVHLVDVREPHEYAEARVPGAILLPLGDVPERVGDFPAESTTYLICRSGARSMNAGEFLAQHGLDVVNVGGGTLAWIEAGQPFDTDLSES